MQLIGTFGKPVLRLVHEEPPSVERYTLLPLDQLLQVTHIVFALAGSIAALLRLEGNDPTILVQLAPPLVVRNIVERVPTTITSGLDGATAMNVARSFVPSGCRANSNLSLGCWTDRQFDRQRRAIVGSKDACGTV